MDVSENSGTPNHPFLTGFSIINHPFWGTPIFGNTHTLEAPQKRDRKVSCFSAVFHHLVPTNHQNSWNKRKRHTCKPPSLIIMLLRLVHTQSNTNAKPYTSQFLKGAWLLRKTQTTRVAKKSNFRVEKFTPPSLHQRDDEKATIWRCISIQKMLLFQPAMLVD